MANKEKQVYIPLDMALHFNNLDELDQLNTDQKFRELVYEEVIKAMEFVSVNKDIKIDLFNISNLDIMISLSKKNYIKVIDNMIKYYTKKENYTKCGELTKLKQKL